MGECMHMCIYIYSFEMCTIKSIYDILLSYVIEHLERNKITQDGREQSIASCIHMQ